MLKPYNERLTEIQELSLNATLTDKNDLLVSLPLNYVTDFNDLIGTLVKQGAIIKYEDIKYLVMQSVTPIESQLPSNTGMLAIYKPYREKGVYEWLYGEYCVIGDIRTYNGVTYVAVQDPNTNIYTPNLVPAIWQVQ